METGKPNLGSMLQHPCQYNIPVFQRYYSWEMENWKTLWTDILELFDTSQSESIPPHFFGTIVFTSDTVVPGTLPSLQVIDGQQRILTFSILLSAIRNLANNHQDEELANEITNTTLVHPFKRGDERYRVFPRIRDRRTFLNIIDDNPLAVGKMRNALYYFYDQVSNLITNGDDPTTVLRSLFNILSSHVQFVTITLTEGENAYKIFESLNATGIQLEEIDLIRNYVFMQIEGADNQEKFDDKLWSPLEKRFLRDDGINEVDSKLLTAFVRDYLMTKEGYIRPSYVFEKFREVYKNRKFNPTTVTNSLDNAAYQYEFVIGRTQHSDEDINESILKLRELKAGTTNPVLLKLLLLLEEKIISLSEVSTCLGLVSGFILRRFINGDSSRAYGRWFASLAGDLQDDVVKTSNDFLIDKGFPNDKAFTNSLITFTLYGSGYERGMLTRFELQDKHKEPTDLSNTEVEHIMPQTLTDDWLTYLSAAKIKKNQTVEQLHEDLKHTLGNLTLSGYNREVGAKLFDKKRKVYRESNVKMTRDISSKTDWRFTQIVKRNEAMANLAVDIWRGPISDQ